MVGTAVYSSCHGYCYSAQNLSPPPPSSPTTACTNTPSLALSVLLSQVVFGSNLLGVGVAKGVARSVAKGVVCRVEQSLVVFCRSFVAASVHSNDGRCGLGYGKWVWQHCSVVGVARGGA